MERKTRIHHLTVRHCMTKHEKEDKLSIAAFFVTPSFRNRQLELDKTLVLNITRGNRAMRKILLLFPGLRTLCMCIHTAPVCSLFEHSLYLRQPGCLAGAAG